MKTLRTAACCTALLAAAAAADTSLWQHRDNSGTKLLAADRAFNLIAAERDKDGITVSWDIAPGYYLYRKRLGFAVLDPAGLVVNAEPPAGERIHDAYQGDAEIYRGSLRVSLRWNPQTVAPRKLQVRYQGCAEAGVCYPPQTKSIDVIESTS